MAMRHEKKPLNHHYKKTIPAIKLTLLSILLATLQGCDDKNLLAQKELSALRTINPSESYQGCLSGESITPSQNRISIEVVPGTEALKVLRDGVQVLNKTFDKPMTDAGKYIFVDENLLENSIDREYTYQCYAKIAGAEALGKLTVKISSPITQSDEIEPISSTPVETVSFEGISQVEKIGTQLVKLSWQAPKKCHNSALSDLLWTGQHT